MTDIPETRYVRVGSGYLAYQVFGEGPIDIVLARTVTNHVEAQWEEPRFASYMRGLASFARVIVWDARSMGLSDPLPGSDWPGLDSFADEMVAVMDAADSERAAVVVSGLALHAFLFAATHPDRVSALVAVDSAARVISVADYPIGLPEELFQAILTSVESDWGNDRFLMTTPSPAPDMADWLAHYRRLVASPGRAAMMYSFIPHLDVRHVLEAIRVPALVVTHAENPDFYGPAAGRYLAEHIPEARFVELPGSTFWFWGYPDPDAVAELIEEFLLGVKISPSHDRVLSTVLFTDVVESTAATARLGDRRWMTVMDSFDSLMHRQLDRFGGKLIKPTGDGHMSTFDAPGRAIRCACALRESVGRLDLEIRAGLHTGEVELHGGDVAGLAVNIGRRVCETASGGEVLVSGAVPPLVAGSGIEFDERGEHELRGVPGRWQLYAVK